MENHHDSPSHPCPCVRADGWHRRSFDCPRRFKESPEIKRNRELLEGDSEAVIVRRWYSRSNTDGGARAMFRGSSIEIEADGRITVRGKQAPPWVLQMLGESVDEPDASEQHSP